MKGISGIELLFIYVVFSLTIILGILIPILFLKIHIVRVLEIEYKYSNSGLAIISLLSDRAFYERLSAYVAGFPDFPPKFEKKKVIEETGSRLDLLVQTQCYKLSSKDIIVQKTEQGCNPEYKAKAFIVLPYNQMSENLVLAIE